MNILEAIEKRCSIRTFNGLKIDSTILAELNKLCSEVEQLFPKELIGFNNVSRPRIAIVEDTKTEGKLGTYGVINGARCFAIMGYEHTQKAMLMAGYIFERFVLECTRLGIDTCWIGGTFGSSSFQEAFDNHTASEPGIGYKVGIVSPLGHRTPKTRFAERLMRGFLRSSTRLKFEDLFPTIKVPDEELVRKAIANPSIPLELEDAVGIALEMTRLAPSSRNSQPWRVLPLRDRETRIIKEVYFMHMSKSRFLDIDLGIAICHFTETMKALGQLDKIEINTPTFRMMRPPLDFKFQ